MPLTLKAILAATHGLDSKYIHDFDELDQQVRLLKASGFNVVLTQGVYDMFHVGHARYLADARTHGDVLIVGVDSDELTFKGTDEITGDKFKYRASKRTSIYAEKSLFKVIGKKELAFSDIQKGQRLEIKYNELLPTSVTEIKVLKPKEEK